VFTFALQFVLHLTVLVIAYGRILAVLRRQGKVMPTQGRTITVTTKETAAGSSTATTENEGKSKAEAKGEAKGEAKAEAKGGQSSSTGLSKARVNVIRTMILIVICFVVCFMPIDFYFLYRTLTVSYSFTCLLFIVTLTKMMA